MAYTWGLDPITTYIHPLAIPSSKHSSTEATLSSIWPSTKSKPPSCNHQRSTRCFGLTPLRCAMAFNKNHFAAKKNNDMRNDLQIETGVNLWMSLVILINSVEKMWFGYLMMKGDIWHIYIYNQYIDISYQNSLPIGVFPLDEKPWCLFEKRPEKARNRTLHSGRIL